MRAAGHVVAENVTPDYKTVPILLPKFPECREDEYGWYRFCQFGRVGRFVAQQVRGFQGGPKG